MIPAGAALVIDAVRSSTPGKGHYAATPTDSVYVVCCPRCGDYTTLIVTRVMRGKVGMLRCPGCCHVRVDVRGG